MKTIFLISLFLLLSAFGRHPSPVPAPQSSPSPLPTPAEPYSGPRIIALTCDGSCHPDERVQLPLIEEAMNRTLSSDCFTQYFKTPGRRLDLAQGLSPDQILAKLRAPTSLTASYYTNDHTPAEGYEQSPNYSLIHMNRSFTSTWPVCGIASLAAHEMTHTKGFWHNGNRPRPNYYTIPYQTNNAFEGNDDMKACCR